MSMSMETNESIMRKIEVFKAVLLMPNLTNDLKEVYIDRIQSLENELGNNGEL